MKSTVTRLLYPSLILLFILMTWTGTVHGAVSGTIILKSGERYEKITFMVDYYRKVVTVYVADTKTDVRFDQIDSIIDKDGMNVTDALLRRGAAGEEHKWKPVAEIHLERLVERVKKKRERAGAAWLGGGVGLVFIELAFKDDDARCGQSDDVNALTIGTAIAMGSIGILNLSLASGAKRAHKKVLTIENAAEQEQVGQNSLRSLAAGASMERFLIGAMFGVFSVYYFAAQPLKKTTFICTDSWCGWEEENLPGNAILGALLGAIALLHFAVPSMEEKTLRRYLNEVKESEGPKLGLGVCPYGDGLRIAAVVSF